VASASPQLASQVGRTSDELRLQNVTIKTFLPDLRVHHTRCRRRKYGEIGSIFHSNYSCVARWQRQSSSRRWCDMLHHLLHTNPAPEKNC